MTRRHRASRAIDRRAFLRGGSLLLWAAGAPFGNARAEAPDASRTLRIGLVTDLHYADKPAAGTRQYRDSLVKLADAAAVFRQARPDLVVELGDLVDAADSPRRELEYLRRINADLAALACPKHYVLGNHCVHTLTKSEFLAGVGQARSFYSVDAAGLRLVILDACFRRDGQPYGRANFRWNDANLPDEQVEWLRAELAAAPGSALVFVHQRLDVKKDYAVGNAAAVRKVLEQSGKVLAVFQGHSHQNDYQRIGSIHYCTLSALVEGPGRENNSFALLDVLKGGGLRLTGFKKQTTRDWPAPVG